MDNINMENILAVASKYVPSVRQLVQEIDSPDKIDAVTKAHGMNPRLYNFYLATRMSTPLGDGLYVPVQISIRDGGRKSLYFLDVNEEVLAGTLVTQFETYDWFVRRDSGTNGPAKTGDLYTARYLTRDGREVSSKQVTLRVIDESRGIGFLEGNPSVWVGFSCIRVEW